MQNHHQRTIRILVLALFALTTAGCGGGGGGGSDGSVTIGQDAEITAQTASELSGDVMDGLMDSAALAEFGGVVGLGATGASPGGALSKTTATLAAKASEATGMPALAYESFGPAPTPCAAGGTVTVGASLRQPGTLTPGDSISIEFTDCDNGEGQTVSGALRLSVESFEGDFESGYFLAGVGARFEVLAVTEDGETHTVNGGIELVVDTTGYPVVRLSHSGDGLALTERGETLVFADWTTRLTVDASSQPPSYRLAGNGRLDLPRHGGVSYRVESPFTGFGDGHPDSGVLVVEGRDGATVTITALSSDQLELEMDYDGDGVIDEVRLLNWAELEG
jgi:hypothetical protein